MPMTIHDAMGMIANAQVALFQHGFQAGDWGPCGFGVDGRYGPDTRTAFAAYASSLGMEFAAKPSDSLLSSLEAGPMTAARFDEAIAMWNEWRAAHADTPTYEVDANTILCEATGVCGGSKCPDFSAPPVPPPGEGAPIKKKGLPWWFWGIMGVTGAAIVGFVGYQIYKDYKVKARRRVRGAMAPAFTGGYQITPVEMGEGGYDGYGEPDPDPEPEPESESDESGEEPEGFG